MTWQSTQIQSYLIFTALTVHSPRLEKQIRKMRQANAASGLSQLKSQIESSGQSQNVVGYGMRVNDGGTASFFAVLKKSPADQKVRIEKKAVEKKEAKKAEEKNAEKKEKQDKLKEAQQTSDDDDTITISAGSIEELIKKINDYTFSMKSDNVQTEAELQVGQHIDFRG
jgi:predicted Zn-dependent protease